VTRPDKEQARGRQCPLIIKKEGEAGKKKRRRSQESGVRSQNEKAENRRYRFFFSSVS
jgi:hypothetical protein